MLIDNDATSRLRLWPRIEMRIKRMKERRLERTHCAICGKKKAATVNMGKHSPTQRRKVMTIIWGICGECANILQPAREEHNITRHAVAFDIKAWGYNIINGFWFQ